MSDTTTTESNSGSSSEMERPKSERSKTDSSKTGSSQTESSQTESSQTESSQTESSKTESSKTEFAQSQVTHPVDSPYAAETVGYDRSKPGLSEAAKYVISFLVIAAGVGVLIGLSKLKKEPADQPATALIPMVSTVDATSYSGELDMVVSGTVVPYREVTVAAEVAGNVIKKYESFEAGNFVKKGTKLLEIDPGNYKLLLKTNQAEVAQSQKLLEETEKEIVGANRSLKLSQSDYRLQNQEYQRNARLKGVLSDSEIDQAKRNLLTAQTQLQTRQNTLDLLTARLERMKASLDLSKSNLERTEADMAKTTIYAPDDGVIVRENVQEGNYVNPGMSLVTFEDTRRSEVICNLTTDDLDWIRNNSPASAEFEEASDDSDTFSVYYLPKTKVSIYEADNRTVVWSGILERFDGIGRDSATKTIPCRITVEDPIVQTQRGRRALVRGMYVKCKIQVQTSAGDSETEFISFPAVALRPGNHVWVVKDRKLYRRDIEIVDRTETRVGDEIEKIVVARRTEEGVQPGDMVVVSPLSQPTNGTEIVFEGEKDTQTIGESGSGESGSGESGSGETDQSASSDRGRASGSR